MLSQERYKLILEKLDKESVVYLNDLVKYLNTSESTIRRDLTALDKLGLLRKVHGGATSIKDINITTIDDKVENRQGLNINEKILIAEFAASLIKDNDFVYIDAGTTTEFLIDYIDIKLIQKNCITYILGGELKLTTEAIVGAQTVSTLKKYNFTKGFFGTNGVDIERGFTTPDIKEAMVKDEALHRSKKRYILCDNSKFEKISSVTFADIKEAKIITTNLDNNIYRQETEILEVRK